MTQLTAQQAVDLAAQYHRGGKLAEAESIYRQILASQPQRHDLLQQLAQITYQTGRVDESLELIRKAAGMAPAVAGYRANLAMILSTLGRFEEAIPEYRLALSLQPNLPDVYNNLGNLLRETGRADEAEAAFRKAIALGPSDSARWNLSFMLLARGQFAEGWPAYEARLKMKGFPTRQFPQPMWDGADLHGRRILLHAEQGMGDTFNFIRYAPLVRQRGGRVLFLCQPEVHQLLTAQHHLGVEQWIADGQPLPPFDVQCPLLSLPGLFNTTFDSIPREVPYLFADPSLVARWRTRLETPSPCLSVSLSPPLPLPASPLLAGLVWAGSPTPLHNRKRSTTLADLAPLTTARGVTFVSLQKGEPAAQARFPLPGMHLLDFSAELENFADTAALIAALDLVISIDTGVAHLSGAMGKPTWVLLPFVPDWRWFTARADSPWYPTMRLFRQPRLGDWQSLVAALAMELPKLRAGASAHHPTNAGE